MGIGPKISTTSLGGSRRVQRKKLTPQPPNPNPRRFTILQHEERNGYLLLMLQYDGCTNYEGRKLLVFQGVTFLELVNQGIKVGIDPHFADNPAHHHPIMRFTPDEAGWKNARRATT